MSAPRPESLQNARLSIPYRAQLAKAGGQLASWCHQRGIIPEKASSDLRLLNRLLIGGVFCFAAAPPIAALTVLCAQLRHGSHNSAASSHRRGLGSLELPRPAGFVESDHSPNGAETPPILKNIFFITKKWFFSVDHEKPALTNKCASS